MKERGLPTVYLTQYPRGGEVTRRFRMPEAPRELLQVDALGHQSVPVSLAAELRNASTTRPPSSSWVSGRGGRGPGRRPSRKSASNWPGWSTGDAKLLGD